MDLTHQMSDLKPIVTRSLIGAGQKGEQIGGPKSEKHQGTFSLPRIWIQRYFSSIKTWILLVLQWILRPFMQADQLHMVGSNFSAAEKL